MMDKFTFHLDPTVFDEAAEIAWLARIPITQVFATGCEILLRQPDAVHRGIQYPSGKRRMDVRLPDGMADRLTTAAALQQVSRNQFCRQALMKGVAYYDERIMQ